MQWRNTATRYGVIAATLHWIIVAGIIAQYFLAEAAEHERQRSADALDPANLHDSIGITLLALALVRVLWRLVESPPPPPPTLKSHEVALARAVHITFYVLLFALPLSGWALATADGLPLSFFGWFDLPQLRIGAQLPISGGTLDKENLESLHELLFNVLVGLALLHVAAAMKHQLWDHDGILRSMLPGARSSRLRHTSHH